MTQEQIRLALENAVGIPEEALRAAVANPAELAPAVLAVAQSMAGGRLPMPPEANLLRFGLHALSAARYTAACPTFLLLLRRPQLELDWLFGEDRTNYLDRLLLGLFDGDDAALCALAADKAVESAARSAALSALSRLAWEGRASRDAVVAVLDRIDLDGEEDQRSFIWFGWQQAIMLLGLTDWTERVQRAVDGGRKVPMFDRAVDRKDWLERIQAAAEHPENPQRFIDDNIVPFDDPVAGLEWSATAPGGPHDDLTDDELSWLDVAMWRRLIANRDAMNMNLEQADGYFTALAAGPVRVPPADALPIIWDADTRTPLYDTPEHDALVAKLLTRHFASIERTLAAGEEIRPWIVYTMPDDFVGALWARGYAVGVAEHKDAWQKLLRTKRLADRLTAPMAALIPDPDASATGQPTPLQRSQLVQLLPDIVAATWSFWRGHDHSLLAAPHERTPKIGRNDPCPCGSGKKYKRCCGAAA